MFVTNTTIKKMFIIAENKKSYKNDTALLTEYIAKLLIPPQFHK